MSGVFSCSLFDGAEEALQAVKNRGSRQSVLSATDQGNLDIMMNTYGVLAHLDSAYGIADKLAHSKLQRGKELIRISGVDPLKTVMVGDTDHDYEVAQGLGIQSILVTHGHQSLNRLSKTRATIYDSSLRELRPGK